MYVLALLMLSPANAGKYDPPKGFQGTLELASNEPSKRDILVDDSQSCGLLTSDLRRVELVDDGFHLSLHETYTSDTNFDRTLTLELDGQQWEQINSSQLKLEKKRRRVTGRLMITFSDFDELDVNLEFDLPRCKD